MNDKVLPPVVVARYSLGAQGAKYPTLNIVDWHHPGGPKVIGAVPQGDDLEDIEAAKAIIRLMEVA